MKKNEVVRAIKKYDPDIEPYNMTKAKLRDRIREISDENESFENMVFELGVKSLQKRLQRIVWK